MEPWVWTIVVSVVAALIGVIYWSGQTRDDKQDIRADKNEQVIAAQDQKGTGLLERVVRMETKIDKLESEVGKLRDMRHEILDRVTRSLSEWYVAISDHVRKLMEHDKR